VSQRTLPCGLPIPNRVALAPLTNLQSHPDGTLGEDELRWLVRRAEGGFGWVSTCAAYISDEGKAWRGQLGITSDAHLPKLTRLAETLATNGALSVVQLHHAGALASLAPDLFLGTHDIPGKLRGATAEDLTRVTEDFVHAAKRAEAAGFSGVEVHGANGYLFTQFLSPTQNRRADAWGGGLAQRARFFRETVRAVRAAVSPGFAVGARLSPMDIYSARGLRVRESLEVARWLAEDGADFIHLSMQDLRARDPEDPSGAPVVRLFRDALPADVALLAAGGVWTRGDFETARALGVDVVVLGKVAIGNPDWPRDVLEAGEEPQRPPFSQAILDEGAIGPAFRSYLARFRGLIEG